MTEKQRNAIYILAVLFLTLLTPYLLSSMPNYLKEATPDKITGFQPKFIAIFLVFNIIAIGIPAVIHRVYARDYGKIKSIWFFVLFGGITGAFFGEILPHGASIVMILPYSILMFFYARAYKKHVWWKVALTSYLAGMLIENGMNRSPIQIPTMMWVAFFVYPYFWTKIWEGRKQIPYALIFKSLLKPFAIAIILTSLFYLLGLNSDRMSPPLIVLGATLPFIIHVPRMLYKHNKMRNDKN